MSAIDAIGVFVLLILLLAVTFVSGKPARTPKRSASVMKQDSAGLVHYYRNGREVDPDSGKSGAVGKEQGQKIEGLGPTKREGRPGRNDYGGRRACLYAAAARKQCGCRVFIYRPVDWRRRDILHWSDRSDLAGQLEVKVEEES